MSGAYPWDTCGHSQVHSGRAQGMTGLGLDGALRTCTVFIDMLSQILTHGWHCTGGTGSTGFSWGSWDAPSVVAE